MTFIKLSTQTVTSFHCRFTGAECGKGLFVIDIVVVIAIYEVVIVLIVLCLF